MSGCMHSSLQQGTCSHPLQRRAFRAHNLNRTLQAQPRSDTAEQCQKGHSVWQTLPQRQRKCSHLQAESDSKTSRKSQTPSSPPAPSRPLPETDASSAPGSREPFSSPTPTPARQTYKSVTPASQELGPGGFQGFLQSELPGRLGLLLAYIVFSRAGVFVRLPGVDVARFQESMTTGGLLGYVDALSGGSISRVGVFSLGIVPAINASIILQLLSTSFPYLKKLQRDEGPQGRQQFELYQKWATLGFAFVQAFGQLTYIRPYVDDYNPTWLFSSVVTLAAGSMMLTYVGDQISDLKLGNGSSVLITANIASSLPASVGAALTQAASKDSANLGIYGIAFLLTTLGVVYVQEAERQIPMNYSSAYRSSTSLSRQAYLPFKVNATGVMPVIFSSSLLALPAAAARYTGSAFVASAATLLGPSGALYLPVNVALIVMFNYFYTFIQLEPAELSEQLKRQGASIPAVRPGRATSQYITRTLTRMSILGSAFLGVLAAAPTLVESITKLTAFRGFAGTSILILVGVATDTARRFRAEQAMSKYKDIDKLYDELKD